MVKAIIPKGLYFLFFCVTNVLSHFNIDMDYDLKNHSPNFELYDEEEALDKFKELCQPEIRFGYVNTVWFYLITFFLDKKGYVLEQFPNILSRPPVSPIDFTYSQIRTFLFAKGEGEKGAIRYQTRRNFISNFNFVKTSYHIDFDDKINEQFKKISNRDAYFENLSLDEKLHAITNLIENFLRKDDKYINLDYDSICLGYITDETIIKYRKRLHCFRHSTEDALSERNSYSIEQKKFLIDYGLVIIKSINVLLNKEK